MQRFFITSVLLSTVLFSGCGDDDNTAATNAALALPFAAVVGSESFACGQSYEGLGTSQSTLTPTDMRFYIHDLRLVSSDGEEVAVSLMQDQKWQQDGVALLDFEDGSNGCDGGNADTNTAVFVDAPTGSYTALRFKLGVPFSKNHQDAATAAAPFNITSMFWNWQGGYKFVRIDGKSSMVDGWRFHLGSTGCDGDMTGNVTSCANENRTEITLDAAINVTDSADGGGNTAPTVSFDIAELVKEVDLDTFAAETPKGCMGGAMDPDCEGYFAGLGLAWGQNAASPQRVFVIR